MKKAILAWSLAGTLAVGGGVGTAVVLNTPEMVASNALTGFFEDIPQRQEIAPFVEMMDGGSFSASVNSLKSGETDLLEGISGSGKFYFEKDAAFVDDLTLKIGENQLTADIYSDTEKFYISEESVLGGAYGLIQGEAADALEDSIFNPTANTEYALPQEIYDVLHYSLELYDDPKETKELQKDAEAILKKYGKELWKAICEYAEFESENDKVRVGGERVSSRVITITMTPDSLADILEHMYEYAEDDDDLRDLIEKVAEMIPEGDLTEDISVDNLLEAYDSLFEGETADQVEASLDMLREGSGELKIKITTPTASSTLRKLAIVLDGETLISVDVGKDGVKKSNCITVKAGLTELSYEIEEDSKKTFEATLSMAGETVLTLKIDKKDETYTLKGRDLFVVSGDFVTEKDTVTVSVEKITVNGLTSDEEGKLEYIADISITIDESDKMPKPLKNDEIKSLDDIEKADFEAGAYKLYEKYLKDFIPEE